MTCQVPYENLRPGPAGKYLAVIDYDTSNKVYYWPVDLDHPAILLGSGLDPSESDPQFHQQMVYAIASQTIDRFEQALGRKIRWSFNRWSSRDEADGVLRIYPHAMQEANAYYSRELRALVFGYFPASEMDPGDNLPGQTVFTCLSHDIIAHETTHALVDSQRDFFTEPTSADAPAFHEAFADLVALFQHFSFKEALLEMIKRTGGGRPGETVWRRDGYEKGAALGAGDAPEFARPGSRDRAARTRLDSRGRCFRCLLLGIRPPDERFDAHCTLGAPGPGHGG